eukprot:TRINITY_DN8736_c0_g1_i1.p1 TRINITY_DN8736_c0_g1~~TRINITY_DN8736_c0_g1_i1.p1  ORF type:complete len:689 (-),score=366.25 TRINITY_DN8736_c0_g1_i1:80-2107(-)
MAAGWTSSSFLQWAGSRLDATRFKPFWTFNNYYVHYSTWLGAIWPYGVATLLFFYAASDFVSWARVPDTEDTSFLPLTGLNDLQMAFPTDVKVGFYPRKVGGLSVSTESQFESTPFYNTSFFHMHFEACTRTRSTDPLSGANTTTVASVDGTTSYTVTSEANVTITETCIEWGIKSCDGSGNLCLGDVPAAAQAAADAGSAVLCNTDNSGGIASGGTTGDTACMRGSESSETFQFVRLVVQRCGYGANLTTVTEPATCQSTADIDAKLKGGIIKLESLSPVPEALFEKRSKLQYTTTFLLPVRSDLHFSPSIFFQMQYVQVLPSYVGGPDEFRYPQLQQYDAFYEVPTGKGHVATLNLQLQPTLKKFRVIPVTLLFMLAKLGSALAAAAIVNFIVHRINFVSFYWNAKESWFVPDQSTRKFLLANRKTRVKEYENQLMYAFTFGGVERFGLQTKHLFQYFKSRSQRRDRAATQVIVDDVQQFMMRSRISEFVDEDKKHRRTVEENYRLQRLAKPSAMRRYARALSMIEQKDDLHTRMQRSASTASHGFGMLRLDELMEDDSKDDGRATSDPKQQRNLQEVETTMKLTVLQDELDKIKMIVAQLFPGDVQRMRLVDQLNKTYKEYALSLPDIEDDGKSGAGAAAAAAADGKANGTSAGANGKLERGGSRRRRRRRQ